MDQEVTTTDVTTATPQQVVTTTTTEKPIVNPEHPQAAYQKKKTIFRLYQIIWFIVGLIEVLLIFRILLKVLGANAGSGFVNLIYTLSDPFALPFAGIFGITVASASVFEWSTIVAGLVYLLIGFGLVQLMQLVKPTTPKEVEQVVNNP